MIPICFLYYRNIFRVTKPDKVMEFGILPSRSEPLIVLSIGLFNTSTNPTFPFEDLILTILCGLSGVSTNRTTRDYYGLKLTVTRAESACSFES